MQVTDSINVCIKYFLLTMCLFFLSACSSAPVNSSELSNNYQTKSQAKTQARQKKQMRDEWGIEIESMRVTAEGHMIDFRYRVFDATKAAPLFVRSTKPYLLHQASGKALGVPNTAKIGSLRNSNTPKNDKVYWMFFGNHKKVVVSGDLVTVIIGDFKVQDIVVE